jgi:hypothetical protein
MQTLDRGRSAESKFSSLPELNHAIRELLARLNERPFRKRDGSRSSLFHSLEKPALAALPAERFDMSQWSRATVNIDYHIPSMGTFIVAVHFGAAGRGS